MIVSIAKSGEPTAVSGSVRLHSQYDPAREAERFLDEALRDEAPKDGAAILVVGPVLGYLPRAIRRRYPKCRVLCLHLNDEAARHRIPDAVESPQDAWSPGAVSVEDFLFSRLDETSIGGLKLLDWPTAVEHWPQLGRQVHNAVATVIRRLSGNITTTAVFGRLWIRNALRNFLELEQVVTPAPLNTPVVLAAAGPSLEQALPEIVANREAIHLWSLPSAMEALVSAGMVPDLMVTTDPGHWARYHLRSIPRKTILAMPLSAAASVSKEQPRLLIAQGDPGEAFLMGSDSWPFQPLPTMGTVAATAVELWRRLGRGPLYLAGLDLCWTDLRSHARPHGFDGYLFGGSSRIRPRTSILWDRAQNLAPDRVIGYRSGPALRTYADWFRQNLPSKGVYRLCPSPVELPQAQRGRLTDRPWAIRKADNPAWPVITPPLDGQGRERRLWELLDRWQTDMEAALPDRTASSSEGRDLLYSLDAGAFLEWQRASSNQRDSKGRLLMERGRRALNRIEAPYRRNRHG